MKILKKLMGFFVILTMITGTIGTSNVFAGELRKGTVRFVLFNRELDDCADEVVYNGVRYLPAYYVFIFSDKFLSGDFELNKVLYGSYNGSITYEFTPSGYMSFFAGSTKFVDEEYEYNLKYHPAVMYDKKMYVSAEDFAWLLNRKYGFDAKKNTIYIY